MKTHLNKVIYCLFILFGFIFEQFTEIVIHQWDY